MFRRSLATSALALLAAPALGQNAVGPLRIALATSVSNEATEAAAVEARAQGLNVRLQEFSDWQTPNRTVFDGEQDANFFQHTPFLEYSNTRAGWNLVPVAVGFATAFGLYSKRVAALDGIREGARIAYSGDAVNTGRSLLLLQTAGLLTLKPGADHRAGPEDIVANPRRLRLVPLDGPQIARALDDVDAVATYPTFARLGGLDPSKGLTFENDPRYAFRFVTRPDRAQDERLSRFIAVYHRSDAVKQVLRRLYGDLVSFPWEQG